MAGWLRTHRWHFGSSLLVLAVLVGGSIILWRSRAEADAGMPPDQQAYWSWVGSINQEGAEAALASGLALLAEHPHVRLLYLRLVDVCLAAQAVVGCREALTRVAPPDTLTHLYREAAIVQLQEHEEADATGHRWQLLARHSALDPTLARLIVDQGLQQGQGNWLGAVEQGWEQQLAADSTAVGAAFGLGYAAVLRGQWRPSERLLTHAASLAPDDPQIYRELGRIYLSTSQPDKFDQVLETGIEAAVARHDLEQELTLHGNLGWILFLRGGNLDKAEQLITEALAQSRFLAREVTEGYNLFRLANIFLRQHRYDEALALIDSADVLYARHVPHRRTEVMVLRGTLLSSIFRFSDAEEVLGEVIVEAEKNRDVVVKIQALVALAHLRYQMGRYQAAREAGLEALALAQQYATQGDELAARRVLGDVEVLWGNYEAAAAHYERGLELAGQTKSEADLWDLVDRLGTVVLHLQDANAARVRFEEMLLRVTQEGDSFGVARAYLGLGRTYSKFQNFTEAQRYYDLALAHLAGQPQNYTRADVLISRARALSSMGSYEEAIHDFDKARHEQSDNLSVAYRVEVGLGNVALSQARYQEALEHFQQAEAVERKLPLPYSHWNVLSEKALAHWRLGHLQQAEAAFEEAIALVETLRGNLDSVTQRAYFLQNKVDVYESFAAFLEEQGRSEEALSYTEQARSRSLVDLLFTMQQEQKTDDGRPTDRVIELNRRVRALARELLPERLEGEEDTSLYSVTRAAQLRREYERADSLYRGVLADVASERPIYSFQPLVPDSMQALLREGEAMIMYDLRQIGPDVPDGDVSVAYVILPGTIMVQQLDLESGQLTEIIRFFRDRIGRAAGGPGTGWEPAARRLYRMLVAPVVDVLPTSVGHLYLVPEGMLHYLPFAALQDAEGRFLAERYTLSVVPSASILKLSRARNPGQWRSMLLLGDPDEDLPGSRQEVLAIAMTDSSKQRRAMVGAEVTQSNLEQEAGKYDILHIATHGRFVARTPWLSHLELHGDDVLSVEEIARLNLNAYLVTLSACETALSGGLLSDMPSGDEWVGLNQAFLAAGTPTVMASLWSIDDQVSSDFMVAFYAALGPAGKAHALAQVQRAFIRNPDTQHPFYWAPFSIVGDPL